MGIAKQVTEKQLDEAQQAMKARSDTLQGAGKQTDQKKRDPLWRKLAARVRRVGARLRRIGEVEALNEEVARRKTTRLAEAASAVKDKKQPSKPKKPKKASQNPKNATQKPKKAAPSKKGKKK